MMKQKNQNRGNSNYHEDIKDKVYKLEYNTDHEDIIDVAEILKKVTYRLDSVHSDIVDVREDVSEVREMIKSIEKISYENKKMITEKQKDEQQELGRQKGRKDVYIVVTAVLGVIISLITIINFFL